MPSNRSFGNFSGKGVNQDFGRTGVEFTRSEVDSISSRLLCIGQIAMRMSACVLLVLVLACILMAQEKAPADTPVFREPFTLKLKIDKSQYYEEHFDKIPYVANNEVYLLAGDKFGINLTTAKDDTLTATYQPDNKKADVWLVLTQEKMDKDRLMMLLTVKSNLDRRLFYDALMTVPEKKEIFKTNMLPVEAHLSNFESWPHPIVQLVLGNFRFTEGASRKNASPGATDPR